MDNDMNHDPAEIPVQPRPFAHGLPFLEKAFARGRTKIVAIGSSSTAGEAGIKPYPERLVSFLREHYPDVAWRLANKGIGGQEAPIELDRFDTDVIAEKPDLVIWQVGTNAVWQTPDVHPDVPTFEATFEAIRKGLAKLRNATQADVILMDLQYVPAILTSSKTKRADEMVETIGRLAREARVNVFPRFEFMQRLHDVERISFDRLVNPDDHERLHQSDFATHRVAWALRSAIVSCLPG